MQLIDLAAQQQRIREKIETNIQTVLNHGKYIMGPEIKELEKHGTSSGIHSPNKEQTALWCG